MSTPSKSLPVPLDAYYDSSRRAYLIQDADGNWMTVDKEGIRMRAAQRGYPLKAAKGDAISPADAVVLRIQHERHILYSGPLAGHPSGLHTSHGRKILVTRNPTLIEPVKGTWDIVRQLFEGMFSPRLPGEVDQWSFFHTWVLKLDEGLRSCYTAKGVNAGQGLILVGVPECGKSLTQLLITELSGGSSISPFQFMTGKTNFNRELFGAAHQMIEDEHPHGDLRSRVKFGEALKQITATTNRTCFIKGQEGLTLTPYWRITISVNDNADSLEVLPPLENGLLDKLLILKCRKVPMPMPASNDAEKAVFLARLKSELPAYLYWLKNEFVVPDYVKAESRFGIRPFAHPDIMCQLSDLTPETRLLSLIDHILFMDSRTEWEGTAEELTRELFENVSYGEQAKRLLGNHVWSGKLLGKLSRGKPERVEEKRTSDRRVWRISRPAVFETVSDAPTQVAKPQVVKP